MAASGSDQGTTNQETFLTSLSGDCTPQLYEEIESEIVSNAGDIGIGALRKRLCTFRPLFSNDQGAAFPIPQQLLESYGLLVPSDIIGPLSTDATLNERQEEELPSSLEYIVYLIYLAVFGILGVFTRYLLQKLFVLNVILTTSEQSILYVDFPSNLVGSFLMGWFGVVFKGDISRLSHQLAIGLSTGYLGSLTTFSGWNQKMLDLSVHGHWGFALQGYFLGLFLVAYSIILGVETAKGFRCLIGSRNWSNISKWRMNNFGVERTKGFRWFLGTRLGSSISDWWMNSLTRHLVILSAFLLMLVRSEFLENKGFKNGSSSGQLWCACLVSPLGVWIRWWLAGLNGRGLSSAGLWKWIPLGTLIANVSAACGMATLSTVKTAEWDTVVTGIQLGLMGSLSTVSTFMAEFHAMHLSSHPWRAHAYAIMTFGLSFGLGSLIIQCRSSFP